MTGRLDGWTQLAEGTTRSGNPFPQNVPGRSAYVGGLGDAICLHMPEGVFSSAQGVASYFEKSLKSPYHMWVVSPVTSEQVYKRAYAGSKIRTGKTKAGGGYTAKLQRLPLTSVGWALRNRSGNVTAMDVNGNTRTVKGETNFRGRLIQITLGGWSADALYLTDDEYEFHAQCAVDVARWLERTSGEEFVFRPYFESGHAGRREVPEGQWMSPLKANVFGHQMVPFQGEGGHWDPGQYNYAKFCDFANHIKGSVTDSTAAPPSSAVTVKPAKLDKVSAGIGRIISDLEAVQKEAAKIRKLITP